MQKIEDEDAMKQIEIIFSMTNFVYKLSNGDNWGFVITKS